MDYRTVPIEKLNSRKRQVRQEFDDEFLQELASSIRKEGIIVPVIVRSVEDKYEIVAGEQRWRAAKLIGLRDVPVSIIDADDKKAVELALLENVKRKDLGGWEREDAIAAMWISGAYKSMGDLAEVLDVKAQTVENILSARKLRYTEELPRGSSTRMITALSSLDTVTRKKILEAQEQGKLARDVHDSSYLASQLRKAPEAARPSLVKAYVSEELSLEHVEKIAEIVEDGREVDQLVDAKRKLPENEFESVVSYIKSEKGKGKKPTIKKVIGGDVHIWNSYLASVENVRDELAMLKPSKCASWPAEEKKRLMRALQDIQLHILGMLQELER